MLQLPAIRAYVRTDGQVRSFKARTTKRERVREQGNKGRKEKKLARTEMPLAQREIYIMTLGSKNQIKWKKKRSPRS